MATVTISTRVDVAWTCNRCGATFPFYGPPEDSFGSKDAAAHEMTCGEVRVAATGSYVAIKLEPPTHWSDHVISAEIR